MLNYLSRRLPDFPWDTLAEVTALARSHKGGIVDLSVGTPVDDTPGFIQQALADASNAPGYPTVWGSDALHQAVIGYLQRRWGAPALDASNVATAVGTKEIVGWLPTLLGLGADELVVIPELAYPTYEVGVVMAGARLQRCDHPSAVAGKPALIWINSPANPHGHIIGAAGLREWVEFARQTGAVLASDECYGEFGWAGEPVSVLDVRVNDGDLTGLLAVFSLSKRSNMAGYRAGFVAGDADLVQELVAVRKHLGLMVSAPVQAAMVAALRDQTHVDKQRGRYARRRQVMGDALTSAGFRVEASQGGLYLWATRDEDGRASLAWLAGRGILVAPGDFYGPAGKNFIRVAMTATDERIDAAVARLA